jgi:hypothetical protein
MPYCIKLNTITRNTPFLAVSHAQTLTDYS